MKSVKTWFRNILHYSNYAVWGQKTQSAPKIMIRPILDDFFGKFVDPYQFFWKSPKNSQKRAIFWPEVKTGGVLNFGAQSCKNFQSSFKMLAQTHKML